MGKIYFTAGDRIYIVDGHEVTHTSKLNDIRSLAVDPVSERIYAGTFDEGLWISDDEGVTWQNVGMDVLNRRVMSLAVSENEKVDGFSVIYAGTEPSMLYRSEDGGQTWQDAPALSDLPSKSTWSFPPRPHTHHIRTIQPDLFQKDRVFVGIELGGVMKSEDRGATWEDRKEGSHHDSHSVRMHPKVAGRIYEAAGEGFARSKDGGAAWEKFNDGLDGYTYMVDVAADPGDEDIIIASVATGPYAAYMPERAHTRLVRREADGPWEFIESGLPEPDGSSVFALETDPSQPGVFYAVNNLGVYISRDAGRSFMKQEMEWPQDVKERRIHDVVLVN